MPKTEHADLEHGRVHYRKREGNTWLWVLYERSLTPTGEVTEEISEQGMCEARWIQNTRPTAQELEAARRLFFEGRARHGWEQDWLEDVINEQWPPAARGAESGSEEEFEMSVTEPELMTPAA